MTAADSTQRSAGASGSSWVWLPLGLLLAFSAYSSLTQTLSVSFEPGLFLPVWAAFLSFRFGQRAMGPLLVAALFTFFSVSVHIDYTELALGQRTDAYLMAAFAALAFCRPEAAVSSADYLAPHWRWTTLLAVAVLAVAAQTPPVFDTEIGATLAMRWDAGAMLAALVLAAGVRWPGALTSLRDHIARGSAIGSALIWCFVILFVGGMLITVDFDAADWLSLQYGFSFAEPWLLVLCFVLAATQAVELRWLLILLLAAWLADMAWERIYEALQPPPPPQPSGDDALGRIVVTGRRLEAFENYRAWAVMINGATAALLGAVIAPYWRAQQVAPLEHRSTPLLLGALLVLQFLGLPAGSDHYFSFHTLALGGVAFVGGLRWGGRGVIAVPLIIQLGCLLSYAAFGPDLRANIMSEAARFGAISFPFAYFGMLARRGKRKETA